MMPIVFVHGVAVRADIPYPPEMAVFLREIVAPEIAPQDPEGVEIIHANWWSAAADFAWNKRCIPSRRSAVLDVSENPVVPPWTAPERAILTAQLDPALADMPVTAGGEWLLADREPQSLHLADFSADQLSDFLVTVLQTTSVTADLPQRLDPQTQALYALAIDDVAHDPGVRANLVAVTDNDRALAILKAAIDERYHTRYSGQVTAPGTLGLSDVLDDFERRVREVIDRAVDLPGDAITRAVGPLLTGVSAHVAVFLADIVTYIKNRGSADAPGSIPTILLQYLARARDIQQQRGGEPIVVLSHSMGGQLVYDIVTTFLPENTDPRFTDIHIDFWCAAASQVAYFEEIKQFVVSRADDPYGAPPRREVPFPNRRYLGAWWNVWDPNDYLSFTADGIFCNDVQDEAFCSGLSGLQAHGGYLIRPSFFHRLADRLHEARTSDWGRGRLSRADG